MTEINYEAIVEALCEGYSDKFNEWESSFMESMRLWRDYSKLSDSQKEKIRQINRKYRVHR